MIFVWINGHEQMDYEWDSWIKNQWPRSTIKHEPNYAPWSLNQWMHQGLKLMNYDIWMNHTRWGSWIRWTMKYKSMDLNGKLNKNLNETLDPMNHQTCRYVNPIVNWLKDIWLLMMHDNYQEPSSNKLGFETITRWKSKSRPNRTKVSWLGFHGASHLIKVFNPSMRIYRQVPTIWAHD